MHGTASPISLGASCPSDYASGQTVSRRESWYKIEGKSARIRVRHLINIDGIFDSERLEGGHVYFINIQKLGTDKLLTKAGDGRKYSVWTTFSNTARAAPDRFYVVIDEAHRGMTAGRSAL